MAERVKSRMDKVRERLTYANVMSTLAAFLGLGTGGAVAVDKLDHDSVGAKQIKRGAVRSGEVKNRSLKGRDIAPGGIGSSRIKDGGVGEKDLSFSPLKRGEGGRVRGTRLTALLPLNKSFRSLATTTIRTVGNSGLLSLGNINLHNTNPDTTDVSTVTYRVLIDGVPQPGEFAQAVASGEKIVAPVSVVAASIAPGLHTVELQAKTNGANVSVGVRDLGAVAGIRDILS